MQKYILATLILLVSLSLSAAQKVEIHSDKLWIDGEAQPQLFGAEVQYFRLRGGFGRNIARAKVIDLWSRSLDRAKEAGMNTISFYIPWDFHEYAEGKFDFDGVVDEDGDGNPDYPSRDLRTFIRLVIEKGFDKIMARPGPYINAEWGFLGFGAIPLWFHQKYPDSHMRNSDGLRTKLYDYHGPNLLRHTQLWFEKLYNDVLAPYIGGSGEIAFLQIDNETNFMWQSAFNHDYGSRAVKRYHDFLKTRYFSLSELNITHGRQWSRWEDVKPATVPGLNIAEDRDWYQFQDYSIYTYLQKLRTMWTNLGVEEPEVLFTLAESYNGMKDGVLPHFGYRNDPTTGMMTMNMYPKTYEMQHQPLLNLPFKADHDVIAMDEATDSYIGNSSQWLLGPEIQGGWWRHVPVSDSSRQQTYLTAIGQGLKGLLIYYFNEGDNWQSDWKYNQVMPHYYSLRNTEKYKDYLDHEFPHEFWSKLQKNVNEQVIVGIDVYRLLNERESHSPVLFFDAPLDYNGNPRDHYKLIKEVGTKLVAPYGEFLADSTRLHDNLVILKDNADHLPSFYPGIDNMKLNVEWAGGLLGYFMQLGLMPSIKHWETVDKNFLAKQKLIIYQDPGFTSVVKAEFLTKYLNNGGVVVSTLGDSFLQNLNLGIVSTVVKKKNPVQVNSLVGESFDIASAPITTYSAESGSNCQAILFMKTKPIGLKCQVGKGQLVQLGGLFYDIYNSDWYGKISDNKQRVSFLKSLVSPLIKSHLSIENADQATVSARGVKGRGLWLTAKNGKATSLKSDILLSKSYLVNFLGEGQYRVKALLKDEELLINLGENDFRVPFELSGHGSEAYLIENIGN